MNSKRFAPRENPPSCRFIHRPDSNRDHCFHCHWADYAGGKFIPPTSGNTRARVNVINGIKFPAQAKQELEAINGRVLKKFPSRRGQDTADTVDNEDEQVI